MPSLELLLALATLGCPATTAPRTPTSVEVRAVWVTRWDFRSAADIRQIVARCSRLGLNRIYLQVRGRADAFYRSGLEPWGEELGPSPGFDPLAEALAATRAHGIELHAWINVLAGWKGTRPPRDRSHVLHTHPEWFLQERGGKRRLLDPHYTMLNPCLPEVRNHITAVVADLVSRYAVDGLHLDYIRFVFPDAATRPFVPYDTRTLAHFRKVSGGSPAEHPGLWTAYRRAAVDVVVRRIAEEVGRVRPGCPISAAVIGDLDKGRNVFLQDAPKWQRRGWVGEIVPMTYELDASRFRKRVERARELARPGTVIPGIGVYRFKKHGDLEQQIRTAREAGARGYCLFAYASFYPTPSPASVKERSKWRLRGKLREALVQLNYDFEPTTTAALSSP